MSQQKAQSLSGVKSDPGERPPTYRNVHNVIVVAPAFPGSIFAQIWNSH